MRKILILILIGFSISTFGQKEYIDFDNYEECRVEVPIKHGRYNQEYDKKVANQFAGKELIVIKTKGNGVIKNSYRGFIRTYGQSDAMATYFEPTESAISVDRKYTVYLIYNDGKTYCFDAACYDRKNGKTVNESEMVCESENDTAVMYFGRGVLSINNNRNDLAIKWLNAAVNIDTTFCDAWAALGMAYERSGDLKGALVGYMEASALDSADCDSWINLQNTFWALGDTPNAIIALKRFKNSVPDNDYSYKKLYDYYKAIGDTTNQKLIKKNAVMYDIKLED